MTYYSGGSTPPTARPPGHRQETYTMLCNADTLQQELALGAALNRLVTDEIANARMAEYRHERRVRAVKLYLRERQARAT